MPGGSTSLPAWMEQNGTHTQSYLISQSLAKSFSGFSSFPLPHQLFRGAEVKPRSSGEETGETNSSVCASFSSWCRHHTSPSAWHSSRVEEGGDLCTPCTGERKNQVGTVTDLETPPKKTKMGKMEDMCRGEGEHCTC